MKATAFCEIENLSVCETLTFLHGFVCMCVCVLMCLYLQDEDKVVGRFASLVQEVLRGALVTFVKLEFLDDVWVSEDPQQHLLCDLERAEQAHLWKECQDRPSLPTHQWMIDIHLVVQSSVCILILSF